MRSTHLEPVARVSRRRIAALLTAAPLAAQVASPPATQKTPPQGAPTPASPSATPDQKLQKAYEDVRRVSARLAKLEVPMNVEPAFAFKP
jgi:hypothetical protein